MPFQVLEILSALLVILVVITQVLIPLFRKTPFFPAFRSRSSIEAELEVARQQVRIAELENERDELLKHAENLRKHPKEGE
jgi:hypothetical protein